MRKLFILFVAIVSLNSLFVQKASSDEYSEFIGTAAIDGVTYSLNYSAYNTQYFVVIEKVYVILCIIFEGTFFVIFGYAWKHGKNPLGTRWEPVEVGRSRAPYFSSF